MSNTGDAGVEVAESGGEYTLLGRVRALTPGLRRSERKVAELVLASPHALVDSPIAQVAQRAGVSEPTVVRFCRSLGYPGFQRFKLALARSLAVGVPYVLEGVSQDEPTEDLAAKVLDRHIATLLQARNHIAAAPLEAAIDRLAQAERIELYGHGASGVVAQDAQQKLMRLGIPVTAYCDAHVHGIAASVLGAGAVVIAISHTGRSQDLLASVATARERGAAVIAITAPGSPLAERATVTLFADVQEDTDTFMPMASRLAHLAILDILALGLALRQGPGLQGALRRGKRALRDKRLPE